MRLTSALLATLLFACGGSSKTTETPAPTETTEETTADTAPAEPAPPAAPDTGGFSLVAAAKLQYQPLDPSQPEGLQVAVVHGDLATGASFYLKIPPGTNAGLHTHTADYHAVLVSGAHRHWIAGGEKKAKPLAAGSHWFQPGGQPHGDACTGTEPCVLFLVVKGGFDFAPSKAKKTPVGGYVMNDRTKVKFAPLDPGQPDGLKAAVLHGDPAVGPAAILLEVPAGANGGVHGHTSGYQALVLEGAPAHWLPHETGEGAPVEPGSYWFQPGGYDHGDRCTSAEPCRAFVYFDGALDMLPPKSAAK